MLKGMDFSAETDLATRIAAADDVAHIPYAASFA